MIKLFNYLFSVIRIGLGVSWLQQGVFKLQAHFTMSGLSEAVVNNNVTPEWFKFFMVHFVDRNISLFNLLIPWGEILVGLGLVLGILTLPAILCAIFMNLNYWLSNMIYIYPVQLSIAVILLLGNKYTSYFSVTRLYFYLVNKNKVHNDIK